MLRQCDSIHDDWGVKRVKRRQNCWLQISCYEYADVAQLAEQLICNQQVIGSSPIIGLHQTVNLNDVCWKTVKLHMGGFPSGQRGQTVNLLQFASVVRIHLHPFSFSGIFLKRKTYHIQHNIAGWSSLEARRAHNPKVIGSNPVPATKIWVKIQI